MPGNGQALVGWLVGVGCWIKYGPSVKNGLQHQVTYFTLIVTRSSYGGVDDSAQIRGARVVAGVCEPLPGYQWREDHRTRRHAALFVLRTVGR